MAPPPKTSLDLNAQARTNGFSLSVIIITENEAQDLPDCLASVTWADEIVVVDSGSTDQTTTIARAHTEKVFEQPWLGFGPQKNYALDQSTSQWILSIDADERITPELAQEILSTLPTTNHQAFTIPFKSTFLGKPIRFGDWRRDRKLRLFRRSAGRFKDVPVHEKIVVEGTTGVMTNVIQHHSYRDRDEINKKTDRYATLGAQEAHANGRSANRVEAVNRCVMAFLRTYIIRLGFLDGRVGLLLARTIARGTYLRYQRLAALARTSSKT
jgi:glycosyltransferase involved in cell wall biosynthesis